MQRNRKPPPRPPLRKGTGKTQLSAKALNKLAESARLKKEALAELEVARNKGGAGARELLKFSLENHAFASALMAEIPYEQRPWRVFERREAFIELLCYLISVNHVRHEVVKIGMGGGVSGWEVVQVPDSTLRQWASEQLMIVMGWKPAPGTNVAVGVNVGTSEQEPTYVVVGDNGRGPTGLDVLPAKAK